MNDGHAHEHRPQRVPSQRRLAWVLALNLAFMAAEAVGGFLTGSLALLADAGHMAGDVGALALSLFVLRLAQKPISGRRTFGLLRAEVLGALFNGVSLIVIVALIFREAAARVEHPQPVDGLPVLVIAAAGLAVNLASAWILARSREEDINGASRSHGAHRAFRGVLPPGTLAGVPGGGQADRAGTVRHPTQHPRD